MLRNVEFRVPNTGEADAVSAVITGAFRDRGRVAAIWIDIVARELDRGSLIAVDDGRVVGHVGLSHAWLDARRHLVDVLILGPVSVCADRQGEGIGTALIAAAIHTAESLGAPVLFLEGSPEYYGKRGFESASKNGFVAPSRRIPEPAFQVALLSTYSNWMTGNVVYRDVWWEHDLAGLRDPDLLEMEQALTAET